jgi:hypothetical protein
MVAVLLKEFRLTESMPPMSGVRFKTVTFVQIVYSIELTITKNVTSYEPSKIRQFTRNLDQLFPPLDYYLHNSTFITPHDEIGNRK